MTRKSLMLLVLSAVMISLAIGVSVSFARDKGAAEMTLQTQAAKKPAQFPHAKHQEKYSCDTCHHYVTPDGTPAGCSDEEDPIAKCESCHKAGFKNDKLNSFKDVGHALCKECHKKEKDSGAPTKCNGCHVKK